MMTKRQLDVRYDVCGKMGICSPKMGMYVDCWEMQKKCRARCKDVSSVGLEDGLLFLLKEFNREYSIRGKK